MYRVMPCMQKEAAQLRERLRNLRWSSWVIDSPKRIVTALPYTDTPHTLAAQVALLACVQPDTAEQVNMRVKLQHWPITHATLQALRGLPQCHELVFDQCTWPLTATEYKALAACVPLAVRMWSVPDALPAGVLGALCEGVCASREGRGLRPLRLRVAQVTLDSMPADLAAEHVSLEAWRKGC